MLLEIRLSKTFGSGGACRREKHRMQHCNSKNLGNSEVGGVIYGGTKGEVAWWEGWRFACYKTISMLFFIKMPFAIAIRVYFFLNRTERNLSYINQLWLIFTVISKCLRKSHDVWYFIIKEPGDTIKTKFWQTGLEYIFLI